MAKFSSFLPFLFSLNCTSPIPSNGAATFSHTIFPVDAAPIKSNGDQSKSEPWGPANLSSLLFPSNENENTGTNFETEKFFYKEGVNYELSSNVVDGEFCDPSSPLSVSGYFGVKGSKYESTSNSKQYFYWMFEKRSSSPSQESIPRGKSNESVGNSSSEQIPFVIWLNGGPGCSSLLGLLVENGPCLVQPDGESTEINPYSWTEAAHVLWLDQPAGVGYSSGERGDFNEDMIGEDAYYFLQSFFQSDFGKKYKDLPLYITGESYAGKYIPAIGTRIWEGNNAPSLDNLIPLKLSGLAIGNGWIDPKTQYQWYAEMAVNNSHGMKLIDDETYANMTAEEAICYQIASACYRGEDYYCEETDQYCSYSLLVPIIEQGICVYNILMDDSCDDDTVITKYLNMNSTKAALHVPSERSWQACNDDVNALFAIDEEKNAAPQISNLLDDGIPILIYAGDLDFICNYLGVKATALNLEWKNADDFQAAEDRDWNNGSGLVRSSEDGLLVFLQVYDAGHMVPMDQPETSLAMIKQFLQRKPF